MWMRIVVTVLLFGVILFAKPGDLDLSFSGDGIVITKIGSTRDRASSVAIQSDDKIVTAGHSYNGNKKNFALARYNPDGSLDVDFGIGGIVTTVVGVTNDFVKSVAIQSDGKIVTAGYSYNGNNFDFALVRYNPDGSLDRSFDKDGILTMMIGIGDDFANSVAIQNDGKIIVAGSSRIGRNNDFVLVRYNPDGSLDTDFNMNGIVITTVAIGGSEAQSITIQSDGKIVVAGFSWNGINDDFALVRYDPDGSLDTSFNNDGMVTTAIGNSSDFANSVVIQNNGKIIMAGSSYNGRNYDFALVRYSPDGSLDESFNSDGIVTTAIGDDNDHANSVTIQSDGKIIVVGYDYNYGDDGFVLVRYHGDPMVLVPIYYLIQ